MTSKMIVMTVLNLMACMTAIYSAALMAKMLVAGEALHWIESSVGSKVVY